MVLEVRLVVPHAQTVPGEMNIVKSEVRLQGIIVTYNAAQQQIDKQIMSIPFADIPAPQGVDMLKTLYNWVEAKAIADGFIGDGVSETLEQPPVEP